MLQDELQHFRLTSVVFVFFLQFAKEYLHQIVQVHQTLIVPVGIKLQKKHLSTSHVNRKRCQRAK